MSVTGALRGSVEPTPTAGLFRYEIAGAGRSISEVFSGLGQHGRSRVIARSEDRSMAARFLVDRAQGHGSWDFYRLGSDFFVVNSDFAYDDSRVEVAPGEGLLEFTLTLSGRLHLWPGSQTQPIVIDGPKAFIWYQPVGFTTRERVDAGIRWTSVSLYVRPACLAALLERNGITPWPFYPEMAPDQLTRFWHRLLQPSPGLLSVAKTFLNNSYEGGMRLMYAEAQALEFLCEMMRLIGAESGHATSSMSSHTGCQLDKARRVLSTQFNPSPRIRDLARQVGMSESKLRDTFKERFGTTIFEFGLSCRMLHALQLLRGGHLSVTEVAFEVGYNHPTSFSAAFKRFYGFLPRAAHENEGHAEPA
jgi:AraC-like DNA-binding protein